MMIKPKVLNKGVELLKSKERFIFSNYQHFLTFPQKLLEKSYTGRVSGEQMQALMHGYSNHI